MGQFKFTECDIEGMFIVEPAVFGDNRGYFMETYNENDFKEAGYDLTFVQDNQSSSSKGVLRGLHLQLTQPQGKLVRVLKGKVFDVGVDLRGDSPTYGEWFGAILSDANKEELLSLKTEGSTVNMPSISHAVNLNCTINNHLSAKSNRDCP